MGNKKNLTPQQAEFVKYYFSPKSETYSNALQSALKAGYSQETSENITNTMPKWLSEAFGKRERMVNKAEKVLEDTLHSDDEKVKLDSAKFITKTIGKSRGYSDRIEHTGADGGDIIIKKVDYGDGDNNTPQV